MRSDHQFHRCYLLHKRHFRESSLLVELFSEEYGRFGAIARGVKTSRSNQVAILQPFQQLQVSWGGQGELKKIYKTELAEGKKPLQGESLIAGFYLNELLMYLLHRFDPHPELYEIYHHTLSVLTDEPGDIEWVLRLFEKELLQHIGYGLQLAYDADSGEAVKPQQQYCYIHDQGPVKYASDCRGVKISGDTLISLEHALEVQQQVKRESKQLMRSIISGLLGDKTLNSRKLFKKQSTHNG